DQHTGGPWREPITNTDRIWHPNGHIAEPRVTRKTDRLRSARVVVAVDDDTVANHRAAEKFDGGILLCQRELFQSGRLRDLCYHPTMSAVGGLSDPPRKRQTCPFDEVE